MTNPYAVTNRKEPDDSQSPSVLLGLVFGLVGYLAPFVILFVMCWLHYDWPVVSDNFTRVISVHRTISVAGLAALAPNFACMFLFGIAGYRRSKPQCLKRGRSNRGLSKRGRSRIDMGDPMALGLATLAGYLVMLLVTSLWFLLPWTWSAERTNLTRSGIVALTPLAIIAIRWIHSRWTRVSAGNDADV